MRRATLAALFFSASAVGAQAPVTTGAAGPALTPAQLQQKVEAEMRRLYALGPSFQVKTSVPKESPLPSLYAVTIEIEIEGQSDSVVIYTTQDGRYLVRGEIFDTTSDPFAANRKQINLEGSPSKGPQNAPVTIVAYSDFQCPTCRALHGVLRALLPQYPNVRFVFKDFPLEQIHPWAMTAHTAARCAYQQSPDGFWKLHDLIFDKQDFINPTNAWDTILDYARQAGLDSAALRTCMVAPETKAIIAASQKEGLALRVGNTPTLFINGRRLVGADQQALEQFITYELTAATKKPGR
jgi:protein-disulfide isomerase